MLAYICKANLWKLVVSPYPPVRYKSYRKVTSWPSIDYWVKKWPHYCGQFSVYCNKFTPNILECTLCAIQWRIYTVFRQVCTVHEIIYTLLLQVPTIQSGINTLCQVTTIQSLINARLCQGVTETSKMWTVLCQVSTI